MPALKRTRINPIGKKTRATLAVNRRNMRRFFSMGIESCEVRFKDCTANTLLTWAHGRKRRELQDGELENLVVLACQNCHRVLDEQMSHEEMYETVCSIIAARELNSEIRQVEIFEEYEGLQILS